MCMAVSCCWHRLVSLVLTWGKNLPYRPVNINRSQTEQQHNGFFYNLLKYLNNTIAFQCDGKGNSECSESSIETYCIAFLPSVFPYTVVLEKLCPDAKPWWWSLWKCAKPGGNQNVSCDCGIPGIFMSSSSSLWSVIKDIWVYYIGYWSSCCLIIPKLTVFLKFIFVYLCVLITATDGQSTTGNKGHGCNTGSLLIRVTTNSC